ncbi:protein lin-28 homolog A-like [Eleginops maclovinus]|uniref:protein lin-28 homolog A-like n=1 Tax=Eleginops maclovinus TaxID=56733 RepID=UPI0030809CA5
MAEAGSGCADEEEKQEVDLGSGLCKWFNTRLGFGFLTMSSRDGALLQEPQDVFVHQSKLHMEGFRSLREGEAVEFTFKKSTRGLESVRVTGPNGAPCLGSERRPNRSQKRGSRGDRCYNCGAPGHHAKQCQLPPQPKKCHICQSLDHMVSSCPIRAQQHLSAGTSASHRGEEEEQHHNPSVIPKGGHLHCYSCINRDDI